MTNGTETVRDPAAADYPQRESTQPTDPRREVVSAADPADRPRQDLDALFSAPVKWGWELVKPLEPQQSPERNRGPQRPQTRMITRSQAAYVGPIAWLVLLAGIGAGVVDFGVGGGAPVGVAFLAAGLAFWGAWALRSSHPPGRQHVAGLIIAPIAALFAPFIALPILALVMFGGGGKDLVPHPAELRRANQEYEPAVKAWQQRVMDFEAQDLHRYRTVDLWYPVGPERDVQLSCLFGGTATSWSVALITLGCSLLGSGRRVLVVDLSRRRRTTDFLVGIAGARGVPVRSVYLPDADAGISLLRGMKWDDLTDVLTAAIHAGNRDPDASRRERSEDKGVLRDIVGCLEPEGPVSIVRLRSALKVVEGQDVGGDGPHQISTREFDRLLGLYNEVQREHGGVLERVTRLDRTLRSLELLDGTETRQNDPDDDDGPRARQGSSGRNVSLAVVGVDKHADELDNDLLADVLFHLVLASIRTGASPVDTLIVLGADRIRADALESLSAHAERELVHAFFFFEHLRGETVDLIGAGGASAGFMTLPNHREAKEASEFIGSNYKWVVSQHTESAGTNLTETWGHEVGESETKQPMTGVSTGQTFSQSFSKALGHSQEYATAETRVREAMTEPEEIQGLSAIGMLYVDILSKGRRVIRSVDFNPQIAFAPRVAARAQVLADRAPAD